MRFNGEKPALFSKCFGVFCCEPSFCLSAVFFSFLRLISPVSTNWRFLCFGHFVRAVALSARPFALGGCRCWCCLRSRSATIPQLTGKMGEQPRQGKTRLSQREKPVLALSSSMLGSGNCGHFPCWSLRTKEDSSPPKNTRRNVSQPFLTTFHTYFEQPSLLGKNDLTAVA